MSNNNKIRKVRKVEIKHKSVSSNGVLNFSVSRFALKKNWQNEDGSLIIESLIALSIALIGLVGVLAFLSQSIKVNTQVEQRFVATYLAAEGLEIVKSLIDLDYSN